MDASKYLSFLFLSSGDIQQNVIHRIYFGCQKWRAAGILCDRCVPLKIKSKFYRMIIRLAYGSECCAYRMDYSRKMGVAEWECLDGWVGIHTLRDKISNKDIKNGLWVANIE